VISTTISTEPAANRVAGMRCTHGLAEIAAASLPSSGVSGGWST
jgi:hypothetical protein